LRRRKRHRAPAGNRDHEVEVSAGIKNGDQVVLQPPVNLADGEKVHIIPEAPQATP